MTKRLLHYFFDKFTSWTPCMWRTFSGKQPRDEKLSSITRQATRDSGGGGGGNTALVWPKHVSRPRSRQPLDILGSNWRNYSGWRHSHRQHHELLERCTDGRLAARRQRAAHAGLDDTEHWRQASHRQQQHQRKFMLRTCYKVYITNEGELVDKHSHYQHNMISYVYNEILLFVEACIIIVTR